MSTEPTNVVTLGAKLVRVAFLEWHVRNFPAGTFVQVVAIHSDGSGSIRAACAPREDVAQLGSFIDEHQAEWGLFYAVNPLRESKARKAAEVDISHVCNLHCDNDPRPDFEVAAEQRRICNLLNDFCRKPSLIVSSGHGLQPLWALAEPVPVNDNIDVLKKHNRLLARLLGGDHCYDISRILRLPGTTNFPSEAKRARGYEQATAEVLDSNDVVYRLEDFGIDLLPVSNTTKALIREGDTAGKYASRSEAQMRVVGDLVRAGLADDVICEVLLEPSHPISAHALDQANPERSVRRAIDAARHSIPDEDWQRALVRSEKGKVLADERNVIQALRTAPELHGLLTFDAFALQIQFTRSPSWRDVEPGERWADHDDIGLLVWLQSRGIPFRSVNSVRACVVVVARDRTVHPVREYLEATPWDGVPRLNSWLATYLGAEGNPAYLAAAGRAFPISAVARIYIPGAKADHMIVLEGIQGGRKSTSAEKLAVRSDWFADSIGNVHDKDSALQLAGRWIIEFAELEAMRRSQVTAMKAFVSRRIDKYRPPYGRTVVDVPRQCVFIGTTNESEYLKDQTGNRRYWPVRCGKVDMAALERDRDQLWAEALHAFRAGEQWWLNDEAAALAEQEQSERVTQSELEVTVAEFVEKRVASNRQRPAHIPQTNAFTTRDVYAALGFHAGDPDYTTKTARIGTEVASALARAGCKKLRRVGRGKNERTIYMLPGIQELTADEIEKTRKTDF